MNRKLHSQTFSLPFGVFQVSRGSVVGMEASLPAGRSRVRISVRVTHFSVILSTQIGSKAQPTLPLNGYRGYFPGLKQPEREFNFIRYRSDERVELPLCSPCVPSRSGQKKNCTFIMVKVKVKVKFTLEQATKARRGSIALLFL